MEFDPKIHFAPKKGHGDITVSIPDMRAEIERLEKYVELIKQTKNMWRDGFKRVMHDRDTAWNNAIEAAADQCGHHLSTEDDVVLANDIADRIRALKRRQP